MFLPFSQNNSFNSCHKLCQNYHKNFSNVSYFKSTFETSTLNLLTIPQKYYSHKLQILQNFLEIFTEFLKNVFCIT